MNDNKKHSDGEVGNKNLSVIVETSREYRSSSSASSGASTIGFRSSKHFPYTPSETKNSKINLTGSHTNLQKTKVQSYTTGYEASSESSQIVAKTPKTHKGVLNSTYNLMTKLNTIENTSINNYNEKEAS